MPTFGLLTNNLEEKQGIFLTLIKAKRHQYILNEGKNWLLLNQLMVGKEQLMPNKALKRGFLIADFLNTNNRRMHDQPILGLIY